MGRLEEIKRLAQGKAPKAPVAKRVGSFRQVQAQQEARKVRATARAGEREGLLKAVEGGEVIRWVPTQAGKKLTPCTEPSCVRDASRTLEVATKEGPVKLPMCPVHAALMRKSLPKEHFIRVRRRRAL